VKEGLPLIQLYDMTADIGEKHNVEAQHQDIVKRLVSLLEKYVADGRSTPGPKEKNQDHVDIRKEKLNGGKIPTIDD
jgi:arylsulfatase A